MPAADAVQFDLCGHDAASLSRSGSLTETQRAEWIEYLQSHQDDDGLFRDPLIFDQGWYKGDPEWCGRRHLSCHVVTALTCLGAVAKKPLRFLDPFLQPGGLVKWLEARDWARQPDFVGNEVLNVGTLLQYARDFQQDERCGPVMRGVARLDDDASHERADRLVGAARRDTTRAGSRER